jgi:transcriptional regulator with XRE-family HTH domain
MHGSLAPRTDPRAALVAWRRSIPYTQGEVSALFRVSRQAVGNWETGRARVPAQVQRRLRVEGWLQGKTWALWEPAHDTWLRTHGGEWPIAELARRLSAAFGIPRTRGAVQSRLHRLQESALVRDLLTVKQTAALCGVTARTITLWVDRGWLCLPAWTATRRANQPWTIPPAALLRFCDAHAAQLDPAQMAPGRYQQVAVLAQRRDHWLSLAEAAAYRGTARLVLWRGIQAGRLPAVRQPRRGKRGFRWVVRARDLAAFLRAREQRRVA